MGDPVADLEILLTGNTAGYVTSMERAATAGTAAARAAERAEVATGRAGAAASKSGGGWDIAGKAAHRARQALDFTGVAVLAVGALSLRAASNFQASMELIHTQAGASQTEVERLKTSVLDMAGKLHTTAQKVAANQALEHAFGGGRTSGAIMTLIDESDRLASKYTALGTQASRAAAFQDAWAKTQATFKQKVADSRAAVETLAVKIGNQFLPVLGRLADTVRSAAESVSAHFGDIAAASSALFAGDWSGFAAKIGLTGPAAKIVAGALKDTWQIAQNLWKLVQGFLPDLGLLAAGFGVAVAGALKVLNPLLGFLADNGRPIADVLLAMAAGMLAYKLVTIAIAGPQRAMAAGQWLINAAMDANPIGLTVAAVAALAVGLTLAWKHSETFRDIVIGVFDVVKVAALGLAYGVVGYFRLMLDVWLNVAYGIIKGAGFIQHALGLGDSINKAAEAFAGMKDSIIGSVTKLQQGIKSELDKTVRNTQIQSALTGIALTKGLADRMPAYEALAYKYGMTLPQVLDRARLPAKDKAFLLAMAPVSAVLGTMGPMSAAVAAWADKPRGGMAAALAAAQRAAGALAQTPHSALLAAESGLRQDAFNVGDNITAGLIAGMKYRQGQVGGQAQALGASAVKWAAYGGGVMSPSKLTRYVGEMIGEGLIVGMANRHGAVTDAAGALGAVAAGVPVGGVSMPGGGAIPAVGTMRGGAIPGVGGSGGTTVIHNHIHNHMDIDGREIHRSVQTHELQYQGHNGRSAFSR